MVDGPCAESQSIRMVECNRKTLAAFDWKASQHASTRSSRNQAIPAATQRPGPKARMATGIGINGSVHRNWAFFAAPASGIALQTLWKGWHAVTDIKQTAFSVVFGYVFSWIVSFVVNSLRAPKLLDADRQAEIVNLRRHHVDEMRQASDAFAYREGELQRQIEGLRRKLVEPKIVPEILQYEIGEVVRYPASVFSQGVLRNDLDTIIKVAIRLRNDHKQPTTIQECALSVRTRPPGGVRGSVNEPNHNVQNYTHINLDVPIEYAWPCSGWLFFRMEHCKKEDLIAGDLELSVTDGTGKVSTATMHIA
jgi:hypothetical protein